MASLNEFVPRSRADERYGRFFQSATSELVPPGDRRAVERVCATDRQLEASTSEPIQLRTADRGSPKKTSVIVATTAIRHRIRPYSTKPWPPARTSSDVRSPPVRW